MASASLSITPVEDAAQEGDETIIVNGSGAGLVILPATITLKDNDAGRPAAPTVTSIEFSEPWGPGAGRVLGCDQLQRPDHHRLPGPVPQAGRFRLDAPWGRTVALEQEHQSAESGGGRYLRGAGARGW